MAHILQSYIFVFHVFFSQGTAVSKAYLDDNMRTRWIESNQKLENFQKQT